MQQPASTQSQRVTEAVELYRQRHQLMKQLTDIGRKLSKPIADFTDDEYRQYADRVTAIDEGRDR